jgi:hypothetical protein
LTFTKLFASITESTIWCEDDQTRIVWITMLAMANKNGFVFASIPGLAKRANVPLDSTLRALEKFLGPDPYSRTKEFEGRRIEAVDGGWRLLNYHKHRAMRDEEDRREYMRDLMREKRASVSKNVSNVSHGKPPLAQAEAEAEADKTKIKNTAHFVRPLLEEVSAYVSQRGGKINSEAFCDFYDSVGWKIGNKSMKDWRAAVRTWEKRIQGVKSGSKRDEEFKAAYQRAREADGEDQERVSKLSARSGR